MIASAFLSLLPALSFLGMALQDGLDLPESPTVFDPAEYGAELGMPATDVLVLGTPHLSSVPDTFDLLWLEPLLCRLEAWSPAVIAQEDTAGEQLAALRAYDAIHGGVAEQYGRHSLKIAALASGILAMSGDDALAEAVQLSYSESISVQQRRRLVLLFSVAAEPSSALVHWWQLSEDEQVAADGLTDELIALLTAFGERKNESVLVGARLASRLSLPRVNGMADHSSDYVLPDWSDFVEAAERDQAVVDALNFDTPDLAPLLTPGRRMDSPEKVLPVYLLVNDPQTGLLDAGAQWQSLLRSEAASWPGRQRVAAWESQNLKMTAAIREASAAHPGGRVLVLVGSSHKPYLEAYLGAMSDIRIVSATALLESAPAGCATWPKAGGTGMPAN